MKKQQVWIKEDEMIIDKTIFADVVNQNKDLKIRNYELQKKYEDLEHLFECSTQKERKDYIIRSLEEENKKLQNIKIHR